MNFGLDQTLNQLTDDINKEPLRLLVDGLNEDDFSKIQKTLKLFEGKLEKSWTTAHGMEADLYLYTQNGFRSEVTANITARVLEDNEDDTKVNENLWLSTPLRVMLIADLLNNAGVQLQQKKINERAFCNPHTVDEKQPKLNTAGQDFRVSQEKGAQPLTDCTKIYENDADGIIAVIASGDVIQSGLEWALDHQKKLTGRGECSLACSLSRQFWRTPDHALRVRLLGRGILCLDIKKDVYKTDFTVESLRDLLEHERFVLTAMPEAAIEALPEMSSRPLDELLWVCGMMTPRDKNSNEEIFSLRMWPDFTRLPHETWHMQVCALIGATPMSAKEISDHLNIEEKKIERFIHACSMCGFLDITKNIAAEKNSTIPREPQNNGLFDRLWRKLVG